MAKNKPGQSPADASGENFWQRMDRLSEDASSKARDWDDIRPANEPRRPPSAVGTLGRWLGRLALAALPLGSLLGVGYVMFHPEIYVTPDGKYHADLQSLSYTARRESGSAGKLLGDVLVLHLLGNGIGTEPWTRDEITSELVAAQLAHQWLMQQSTVYLSGPQTITNAGQIGKGLDKPRTLRIFAQGGNLSEEPLLKLRFLPTGGMSAEDQKVWGPLVAKSQGYDSMGAMVEALPPKYGAKELGIVFHFKAGPNPDPRFSMRLEGKQGTLDGIEYAQIFTTPVPGQEAIAATASAHAVLHLFGADDLYRVRAGSAYAENDIMQRINGAISTRALSGLSAFAVGWSESNPVGKEFPVDVVR
ncbi:MAG: hypothetical protein HYZ53_05820 [Planctomycetes bacterium]|nr:hypothetical protein [Planctomycetota bacterium]